ncbi:MAG: adenylate/guanylate cyclase domain-containing protein [Spirochaetia bacterium]|nr:adenylate/guanylate cyclase domain-containing protein [Spirochaetia bacterium]
MSIRTKIILIFSITSALIVGSSAAVSYTLLRNSLISEMKGRIMNIARLGVSTLDLNSYENLTRLVKEDLTEKEVDSIENSDTYQVIYQQLNAIRDIEPDLIRYVYTLMPGQKPGFSRFVVDADVLSLVEEEKKSNEKSEEISHFGQEYDISDPEEMFFLRKALYEKKGLTEENLVYDEEYNLNAISAYMPIYSADGKTYLGILGLDMSDKNIQASLKQATLYSIAIIIISIIIAFIASMVSGSFITRGIIQLTAVCKSFAEKNFSMRSNIRSKDEIGQLSNSFNGMAQTIEDYASYLERLLKAYDHFVPHTFLKLLGKESIIDVKLGDQVQSEMSVLFSDIRSFTSLSESMSPKENFNFINAYLKRVGPLIRDNKGIIDKYIGDAVMALFPTTADDAIKTAIQMQRKVVEYNEERARAGYRPINIGIGIHTGNLMLGTVGESERMDSTVISDAVNLASRIEGVTKIYNLRIIVSEMTIKKLKNPELFYFRLIDKINVKGKVESISIYEIYNVDTPEIVANKETLKPDYNEALQLYFSSKFKESLEKLQKINARSLEDPIVKLYIERCQTNIQNGVDSNWSGTTTMNTK